MKQPRAPVPAPEPAPPPPSTETDRRFDAAAIAKRIDASLLRRARHLVDRHPERALQVVRNWMAGSH